MAWSVKRFDRRAIFAVVGLVLAILFTCVSFRSCQRSQNEKEEQSERRERQEQEMRDQRSSSRTTSESTDPSSSEEASEPLTPPPEVPRAEPVGKGIVIDLIRTEVREGECNDVIAELDTEEGHRLVIDLFQEVPEEEGMRTIAVISPNNVKINGALSDGSYFKVQLQEAHPEKPEMTTYYIMIPQEVINNRCFTIDYNP